MTPASPLQPTFEVATRQRWMAVLACARPDELAALWNAEVADGAPPRELLRPAETGMVMTRGRAGGTGEPFNLGEMTVTRCSVRLDDGTVGHAYVAGRDKRHAEMAATIDALLQRGASAERLHDTVIAPLAASQQDRRMRERRKAAGTRVEFFTLVRGED